MMFQCYSVLFIIISYYYLIRFLFIITYYYYSLAMAKEQLQAADMAVEDDEENNRLQEDINSQALVLNGNLQAPVTFGMFNTVASQFENLLQSLKKTPQGLSNHMSRGVLQKQKTNKKQ